MRRIVWIWSGLALLLALVLAVPAPAQESQLQRVVDLFGQQEYEAAQDVLLEIDREQLSDDAKSRYDRLRNAVLHAIDSNRQAEQALAQADEALEAGELEQAESLYNEVLENAFAKSQLKRQASERLNEIDRRRLGDAAEPAGVVEPEPVPLPQEEKPAAQPAKTKPAARREAEPARAAAPVTAPTPRPPTPVDEMRLRDQLLWQRAVARSEELSARAREAVANDEFSRARQLADVALQEIEVARNYAEPASKYVAAREAVMRLREEIDDAFDAYQMAEAAREREEIRERVIQQRELQEQHRQEKIEQLFNTAAQLRKQQKYGEAAEVLRQILYIEPNNAKAQYQLEIAEDYESLLHQKRWHHDVLTQTRTALVNAQEALIPWDYEVLYPRNWLELSAKREAGGLLGESPENSELNRRLDEILPEFQFDEAPVEVVLDHLREAQDLNMAVDWDDLQASGIERDRPVSIALRDLPVRTVLQEVLSQVGGEVPLGFSTYKGLLRIATTDKLDREKYVRVYDIRDLLVSAARFTNAALFDPDQAPQRHVYDRSSGRRLFDSPGQEPKHKTSTEGSSDEMVEQLMSIIRQTVAPDSWHETGGSNGSIRELNGQLIVYNTSDAHSQVRGLLNQLRTQRALQISLEARFLDVTSNFLEEFGVDLDFVFNSASAGYDRAFINPNTGLIDPFSGAPVLVPRQYTQIGTTPVSPGFGQPMGQTGISQPYGQAGFVPYTTGVSPHVGDMTPIRAQQASLALVDPSQVNTQVPGSFAQRSTFNPALNIAGSFLDNLQVDFLIRATQANGRSAIVQAPRIVMENWNQTFIQVGRTRDYVASIQPTVAEGAALPQPQIGRADSGVLLGVFGVISNDRRYVTVNVNAQQFEEPSFERFEVQRASGNSPGVFVQLRDQGFTTVRTQVHIPDGGTVLLGGVKQVGEIELEAGVPILSKVPILKRFFSNRSTVKDTRTLLILLKAKVIIQSEAEEEAFPNFGNLTAR